jgi:hypothetical protein
MEILGLSQQQSELVQAAVEVRDEGLKSTARSKLFKAMELNNTQQAKLGLAIDLSEGNLNMAEFEQTQYFELLNLTTEQVSALGEVVSISKGKYDAPLNKSKLATTFGIDVKEVEILTELQVLE